MVAQKAESILLANEQNLKGQQMLWRCLETGFVTSAPALARYQAGRGIDTTRREFVGERPPGWKRQVPVQECDRCGLKIQGGPWDLVQHPGTKRCQSSGKRWA